MVQSVSLDATTLVRTQRAFFNTGKTRAIAFRIEQLKRLKQAVLTYQSEILQALKADLNKPEFEAYASEIGVLREIDQAIKHVKAWARPRRVSTPWEQFPAHARVYSEPLGVALIIGPWNYPFQLLISPLVAAIAAGNCAILKPSESAPQTSKAIATLIADTFDPAYITVVTGGVETSQALLNEPFDHIFFTGGTTIGKVVMAAAAKHLTPVTLELGGKSPCIVDTDIDLTLTAKRIVWGRFFNAGQTCIAPDYLLVNRRIKPALLDAIQATIQAFYGDDPAQSPDYGRIINAHHFSRLEKLLHSGTIIVGGQTNAEDRYIAPTVLDHVSWQDPVMQEEIFGPILPVLDYDTIDEAIAQINERPKPLALYIFTRDKHLHQRVLAETSSGGVCINDTIMQVGIAELPFGGVGPSGMGRYHGKSGFDTFSNQKSVLVKSFWPELDWRYAPYAGKLDFLKKIIG